MRYVADAPWIGLCKDDYLNREEDYDEYWGLDDSEAEDRAYERWREDEEEEEGEEA